MTRELLAMVVALAACGGGGGSPSVPSASSAPPGSSAATFTITSAGVSPKEVTIATGQSASFVNQDNVAHEMLSDPHPIHTDCPPMNLVGVLLPGQSRQTGAFPTARTCGFHDHGQSTNPDLLGRIVIR